MDGRRGGGRRKTGVCEMRKCMIVAVAAGALALPGSAAAQQTGNTGDDCSYTGGGETAQTVPVGSRTVTVYAGSGGLTGTAWLAAGACADNLGVAGFQGGAVEAGTGEPGTVDPVTGDPEVYAIVDGDNENLDPQGQSDGYFGVSTYETGAKGSCGGGGGDSSNSGGCLGTDVTGPLTHDSVVACGNTSGNTWNDTSRDGCSIP